jgi:hypothetical protein
MKTKVSYAATCTVCGRLAGSWSRLRRVATIRGERHRSAIRTPEPGVVHDFRIERNPAQEAK